ncbi:hypothetical protein Y032_0116g549 [Ancylostoma ceylanicum]|nr:hypothetical protein Y032_0116g549 [Ancylostoma ceylanicum]
MYLRCASKLDTQCHLSPPRPCEAVNRRGKLHRNIGSEIGPLGNPGSAFFRKAGDPNVLTDPVIKKIASAHGKTPAQIALRWATQQDIIVIPKSTSEARIKENAAIFDFKLTDAEMKEIEGIDRGWRMVDLTSTESDHPHFPFLEEY